MTFTSVRRIHFLETVKSIFNNFSSFKAISSKTDNYSIDSEYSCEEIQEFEKWCELQ